MPAAVASPPAPAKSPHPVIEDAFQKFEQLIRPSDDRLFKQTELEDVRQAAYIISRDQSRRKCLRNLRRIKPLFDILSKLSGPLDTLCQGTPYLCYIWVGYKMLDSTCAELDLGPHKAATAGRTLMSEKGANVN
jgi:hypothetical protein